MQYTFSFLSSSFKIKNKTKTKFKKNKKREKKKDTERKSQIIINALGNFLWLPVSAALGLHQLYIMMLIGREFQLQPVNCGFLVCAPHIYSRRSFRELQSIICTHGVRAVLLQSSQRQPGFFFFSNMIVISHPGRKEMGGGGLRLAHLNVYNNLHRYASQFDGE
jgi:hypothetical protein